MFIMQTFYVNVMLMFFLIDVFIFSKLLIRRGKFNKKQFFKKKKLTKFVKTKTSKCKALENSYGR